MSRRIRFIPEEGALVEVTCRALHSRLLFRPSLTLNEIIIGALARAKSRYAVRICFFAFVSNHFHLLLEVEDAQQLARFMGYFNSKLAREVGRLTGWKQKILGRRYQAIVVSAEEPAQIERLRYGLAHGCKEDLVERPRDWPGVHGVQALTEGKVLEGLWFDRTQEYAARRRGEDFSRLRYATREILTLDPLPCPSTPPVRLCDVGSARPTPCSWPPTAKPPRNSGWETATPAFPPGAILPGCRSWAGSSRTRSF